MSTPLRIAATSVAAFLPYWVAPLRENPPLAICWGRYGLIKECLVFCVQPFNGGSANPLDLNSAQCLLRVTLFEPRAFAGPMNAVRFVSSNFWWDLHFYFAVCLCLEGYCTTSVGLWAYLGRWHDMCQTVPFRCESEPIISIATVLLLLKDNDGM